MYFSKRRIYKRIAFVLAGLGGVGIVLLLILVIQRAAQPTIPSSDQLPTKTEKSKIEVMLPRNPDGSYRLPATYEGWYQLGSGAFTIEIKGSIDFGGQLASPDRSPILGDGEALVPGVPFGVPVAKIGEQGKPFMIGYSRQFETDGKMAYIAVNDSYYADNKGTYIIYKR